MKKSLFILFLMFPNLAHAELCDDPKTQSEINYCAEYHFKRADAELNQAYSNFKARIDKDKKAMNALKVAQRAWLGFRDAECALEVIPSEEGSIKSMVQFDCRTRLTKARAAQFETRLTCTEGDFTCFLANDSAD
jgi:uncharacterized protein YecT (DUF1311 family)